MCVCRFGAPSVGAPFNFPGARLGRDREGNGLIGSATTLPTSVVVAGLDNGLARELF